MNKDKEQSTIAQEPGLAGIYATTSISMNVGHTSTDNPCVYTDEEFRLLLHDAEQGKFQSDEEVRKMFTA